jgi:hypothetical protein
MPNAAMAVNAADGVFSGGAAADDVVDEIAVTPQAVFLEIRGVAGRDHDRLVEVHEREASGMTIAVVRLGQVLAGELMRQVTVNAGGDGVMGPVRPGRVLIVHHMAIPTGARIGREVAEPLAVIERKAAESHQRADADRRDKPGPSHWCDQI